MIRRSILYWNLRRSQLNQRAVDQTIGMCFIYMIHNFIIIFFRCVYRFRRQALPIAIIS